MSFRNVSASLCATVIVALTMLPQAVSASVLFENSVLIDFYVSGPVALAPGQNAGVCVTNVDDSPVSILIGLLQADTGSLLAVRQAAMQPGEGACLSFTQPPAPNGPPANGSNVVGIVVPNAHLSGQGAIVQDRPGGGCITASLQIQSVDPTNNLVGQTLLYVPMQEHHEHGRLQRAD
jgi:hypothetical protein